MTTTTLYMDRICPYAQRARITLEEKQVPYVFKEVFLSNKSQEFTEVYGKALGHDPASTGRVPVIVDGDKILTESEVIAWYIA